MLQVFRDHVPRWSCIGPGSCQKSSRRIHRAEYNHCGSCVRYSNILLRQVALLQIVLSVFCRLENDLKALRMVHNRVVDTVAVSYRS